MDVKKYADELKTLLLELCAIPAPSLEEDARAEFCEDFFRGAGFEEVFRDEAKNVIAPWNLRGAEKITVFMAHTDTVFPDREPMPLREEAGKIFCPGAGDDTANLAILMLAAKILKNAGIQPDCGVLFVANAAEEGLGNLRGCRELVTRYKDRIQEMISFDLGYDELFVRAVGSVRYRVTVRTEGGHSYEDFGNQNAIQQLACIINDLYRQPLPKEGEAKTTFNVGTVWGGTSVNTVAQQAEMLYEYRSDDNRCLEHMEKQMRRIFRAHTARGVNLSAEPVGSRPGMGNCTDPVRQAELIGRAEEIIRQVTGKLPERRSGSTDCNIPFSQGIPALCFGLISMGGAHTREEWVEVDSLPKGLEIALNFIQSRI